MLRFQLIVFINIFMHACSRLHDQISFKYQISYLEFEFMFISWSWASCCVIYLFWIWVAVSILNVIFRRLIWSRYRFPNCLIICSILHSDHSPPLETLEKRKKERCVWWSVISTRGHHLAYFTIISFQDSQLCITK